jgi:hypothetical protein
MGSMNFLNQSMNGSEENNALHCAAQEGHEGVVDRLLAAGADKDKVPTPLLWHHINARTSQFNHIPRSSLVAQPVVVGWIGGAKAPT